MDAGLACCNPWGLRVGHNRATEMKCPPRSAGVTDTPSVEPLLGARAGVLPVLPKLTDQALEMGYGEPAVRSL